MKKKDSKERFYRLWLWILPRIRLKSDEIRNIFVLFETRYLILLRGKVNFRIRMKFRKLIYQRSILAFLFDRILGFRWLIKSRVGRTNERVIVEEEKGERGWRGLKVFTSHKVTRASHESLPKSRTPSSILSKPSDLAHGLTDNNAVFYCTITLKRADKTTLYRVEKKEKKK